jgi:hypothetical protein
MIDQYNAYQPDLGQRINPNQEEWIDPSEIMNTGSRKPFQIKSKTRLYKGIASGQNQLINNRSKLEEDRRQMLQFNLSGTNAYSPQAESQEEEKKVSSNRPPRGTSGNKKLRSKPKSLRSNNLHQSGMRDSSFNSAMNQSNASQSTVQRQNRVTPPYPVKIPREVTDGIAFLRSIRMAAEGSTNDTTYISSQAEESRSPESYASSQNVSFVISNLYLV